MFCGEKSVHTNILLFLKNINEAVDEDFFFTITVFFTGFSKAVDGVTILKKIFKLIPKSADVILDGWKLEALRDCMRNRKQLVHLVHPKNVNFKALNVTTGFPKKVCCLSHSCSAPSSMIWQTLVVAKLYNSVDDPKTISINVGFCDTQNDFNAIKTWVWRNKLELAMDKWSNLILREDRNP